MKIIHLCVDDDMYKKLDDYCKNRPCSITSLIKILVYLYLSSLS